VLAAQLREFFFRLRQFLRQRQLLAGDLVAQLVEIIDALGELPLSRARQSAHRFATLRLLGREYGS
jgi:hypothetical protein